MTVAIVHDQIVVPSFVNFAALSHSRIPILEVAILGIKLNVSCCLSERQATRVNIIGTREIMNKTFTISDPSVS